MGALLGLETVITEAATDMFPHLTDDVSPVTSSSSGIIAASSDASTEAPLTLADFPNAFPEDLSPRQVFEFLC